MSGFHCSSITFDKAQRDANLTGLTHYVGNLPSGSEVTGCDPVVLHDIGCHDVIAVHPEAQVRARTQKRQPVFIQKAK